MVRGTFNLSHGGSDTANEILTETFNVAPSMGSWERMPLDTSDKQTLRLLGRRFVWMTLVLYAALTLGLWVAHATFPSALGPSWDYDYLVSVSLIGALAFGGMYAAVLALWPERPATSSPAETH